VVKPQIETSSSTSGVASTREGTGSAELKCGALLDSASLPCRRLPGGQGLLSANHRTRSATALMMRLPAQAVRRSNFGKHLGREGLNRNRISAGRTPANSASVRCDAGRWVRPVPPRPSRTALGAALMPT
jgi:hypothetical protein